MTVDTLLMLLKSEQEKLFKEELECGTMASKCGTAGDLNSASYWDHRTKVAFEKGREIQLAISIIKERVS